MKTKIEKTKKMLINLICEEAKKIINNSSAKYHVCNIGWVNYVHNYGNNNLIQHEFVQAYVSMSGDILLIDRTGSEGELKAPSNFKMNHITSIDTLELILSGLEENNQNK